MDERILEIRTYRLRPGERRAFHDIVTTESGPLLAEFGIDVVLAGPSEVDEDGVEEYVLLRSFDSLAVRDEQEERFYRSRAWHDGPREGIVSRIEHYHTILLTVPASVVDGLRR